MLPCAYLAPISRYSAFLRERVAVAQSPGDERWQKQTLRNRCYIDSPSGPLALTVPVVHPAPGALMRDVRISDHGEWRHQHWNALCSSYRQTPFFDYYEEDFRPFYEERQWTFLLDFNEALHQTLVSLLGLDDGHLRSALLKSERRMTPYHQMFASRHGFLPDLSMVDLLFNMGPESVFWL